MDLDTVLTTSESLNKLFGDSDMLPALKVHRELYISYREWLIAREDFEDDDELTNRIEVAISTLKMAIQLTA